MKPIRALCLLSCAPILLPASTLSTTASCGFFATDSISFVSSNGGGAGAPHADCTKSRIDRGQVRFGTVQADVIETPNLAKVEVNYDDYRFAAIGVRGEANWLQDFDVVLSGASGAAIFVPCLSVSNSTTGLLAAAVVTIGTRSASASRVGSAGLSDTCHNFPDGAVFFLPFDEPVRMTVMLIAQAGSVEGGQPSGGASASFLYSFQGWLLPGDGSPIQPITNLTSTFTPVEVPEPAPGVPLLLALIAIVWWREFERTKVLCKVNLAPHVASATSSWSSSCGRVRRRRG